jgi:hypothetical protein
MLRMSGCPERAERPQSLSMLPGEMWGACGSPIASGEFIQGRMQVRGLSGSEVGTRHM